MRRLASVTLFSLFALFYLGLSGSAAAATGNPPPTIAAWPPPVAGVSLTAAPGTPGDSINWETCDSSGNPTGSGYLATNTLTYTPASTDLNTDLCVVELDLTGTVVGSSTPVGPVVPGPVLSAGGMALTEGQTIGITPANWGTTAVDTWWDCDASGTNCQQSAEQPPPGGAYLVTEADVGSTIEVMETATAPGQVPVSVRTPATGVVVATIPTITSRPTITGTAQVGDTVSVSTGSWSITPTSYTYQWERCSAGTCTTIPNATSQTYVPVDGDVGDTLEALVTATVYGVNGSPYPSYPTNPVLGIATSPSPTPTPGPVVPVVHPHRNVVGRLTATMRWTFRYAPTYTQVLALAVDGPAFRSTIATRCRGGGCPFHVHRITVRRSAHCSKTTHHCHVPRSVNLEWEFRHHRLRVGTRVMIRISRAHDIGKYYRFVVRPGRAPSAQIRCLAPGSAMPGKGCTGL